MAKSKAISFPTMYSPRERVHCNGGDREKIEYAPKFKKDGSWVLEETGKSNLYAEIQSHAESCDINNIVRRYAMGEVDVLQRVQGAFGDFTQFPKNLAEQLNAINDAKAQFDSLPIEIKEKFGQNYVQFFEQFGTKEFYEKLGVNFQKEQEKPAEKVEKEVKSDES